MKAIKESNKDVAKLLINRDCDLSIADNKNRSALHWAAQLGRVDFVEDLIRGKDPLNSQILGYIDVTHVMGLNLSINPDLDPFL